MTTLGRRIAGVMLIAIAFPIAMLSFALGHVVGGLDSPDIQCAHLLGRPPIPIAMNGEDGDWSVFPLGVACTFDEPGDGIPPQTVVHAHWPATVVWVLTSTGALAGLALAVTPDRWFRARPSS
jgi:hypothetical protein